MSFDLFVSPCPDVRWGDAERQLIIDILYRDTESTEGFGGVHYKDGSRSLEISGLDSWDEDADETRSLCFRRFGGRTFEARLYELADRLDAMVFWPGDPPFVAVTREDLLAKLPVELGPGDKVVVRDADDLIAQIVK